MPWLETSPVEQRERFIRDHRGAPSKGCGIGAGRRTIARTGSRPTSRPCSGTRGLSKARSRRRAILGLPMPGVEVGQRCGLLRFERKVAI